ncbi:MAG: 3-isopropylmalate dehydratase small subunit [Synechococcaceae cyanobacterium]
MSTAPLPSGPIACHRGRGLPLIGADIDTDRIIPARFLKCVTFEGLADAVFADDRQEQPGQHPFDHPAHQQASVLVVNSNFGCGSSREHAPQALMRWGIRAIVGESFAEIFFGNCLALGIPCLCAEPEAVTALQEALKADPGAILAVDLDALEIELESEFIGVARWPVRLAPGPRSMLTSGHWDGTSQLVAHGAELAATAARLPYLNGFGLGG